MYTPKKNNPLVKVGILYGGRSGEHDVSLCSAASVVSAIDNNKYDVIAIGIDRDGRWYVQEKVEIVTDKDFGRVLVLEKRGRWFVNHFNENNRLNLYNIDNNEKVEVDVIFPVIHGSFCEDGTIQGLLELSMVPYVGADVLGSAVAMDKDVSRRLLKEGNIPVVSWITVYREEWENESDEIINKVIRGNKLPLFIKPSNTGSSVGVRRINTWEELPEAILNAFHYDNKILIEQGINGREIECAVLGNHNADASILGEIITHHDFYSYEAKYIDPEGAELVIPAEIDRGLAQKIKKTALEAYRILCCKGMARVDFFLEHGSNMFYLNEINTLPGFTGISMYPKLWESVGLKYGDLIDRLITLAFETHRDRLRIRTEI